jgi:hypothetical protein
VAFAIAVVSDEDLAIVAGAAISFWRIRVHWRSTEPVAILSLILLNMV